NGEWPDRRNLIAGGRMNLGGGGNLIACGRMNLGGGGNLIACGRTDLGGCEDCLYL
ncbi:hypothetical protein A2U01_0057700, partial [Trifolium medium]|nr:hypothetical protein [Trifolium medium]